METNVSSGIVIFVEWPRKQPPLMYYKAKAKLRSIHNVDGGRGPKKQPTGQVFLVKPTIKEIISLQATT